MKNTLIKPQRVQRLRVKGFNLQKASRSGLPVIYVGRPTKWGNPFRLTPGGDIVVIFGGQHECTITDPKRDLIINDTVSYYKDWLTGKIDTFITCQPPPDISELKGKDLACWCNLLDKNNLYIPCHADILIELLTPPEQ